MLHYNKLGDATYFNAVRSSIKIIQVQESGAQAAQSSDGTKIQCKEMLFCLSLFNYLFIPIVTIDGSLR